MGKYGDAIASITTKSFRFSENFTSAIKTARNLPDVDVSDDTIKRALRSIDDVDVINILKELPDNTKLDILRNLPNNIKLDLASGLKNVNGLSDDLANQLDALDDIGGAAADGTKTGDELAEMTYLANRLTRLSDVEVTKINKYFSELAESTLDVEADTLVRNWSTTGRKAFDNLPDKSQEILLKKSQLLRYQAKRSSGLADKLKGACKSAPVYCDIGKGLGGLGAAVGVGFALEEVYDRVMDDIKNDEDIAACISTCYPNDWYDSKASGVGDKEYKDLDFKTIEGLRESTGNDDINQGNTPLCTASMTGESCATMCRQRCEDLNRTFLSRLASAVGDAAAGAAGAAGAAAGEGLSALLDGIFGEGMGIPSAIGIFIVFIVIIIIATTM